MESETAMSTQTNFYSIIDYTAGGPGMQAEIAAAFAQVQKDWVAFYPGYISARFLASTDGTRVRAIVQWESEEAFKNFEKTSDTEGRINALNAVNERLSSTGERHTFRLLDTVTPQPAPATRP